MMEAITVVEDMKQPAKKRTHTINGNGVVTFELDVKYDAPDKVLGEGANGIVCSCLNRETGEHVAVKKIGDALSNRLNAVRTLREMQILRQVSHENVISIKDVMLSSSSKDVYLVQELMAFDLGFIIDSMKISGSLCKRLLFQILNGLGYLHSANVIHRDVKPQNVLLSTKGHVKICDFGHARTHNKCMTDPAGTTQYKAPELLFGTSSYGSSVDMWSVGCVFAEMLGGTPIFSGINTLRQIHDIHHVLGTQSDLGFLECERARQYLKELPYSSGVSFCSLCPEADPLAIDLLVKMLVYDPRKRITVVEALKHPFFSGIYDPMLEILAPSIVKLEVDDNPDLNEKRVMELILEELRLQVR